jgi:hypothetical protein
MFDVIRKKEFFDWCESGVIPSLATLAELREKIPDAWWLLDIKSAEDGWVLSQLGSVSGARIAEIGGSDSRIIRAIGHRNECWNVDPLDGRDGGALHDPGMEKGAKVVRGNLGEFRPELPSGYFDFVISVSVIEHVPLDRLPGFFSDMFRIMKPGGRAFHAIDIYIDDLPSNENEQILSRILVAAADAGLEPLDGNRIGSSITLKSDYATHSDMGLMAWNQSVPSRRSAREQQSVVALKAGWRKP